MYIYIYIYNNSGHGTPEVLVDDVVGRAFDLAAGIDILKRLMLILVNKLNFLKEIMMLEILLQSIAAGVHRRHGRAYLHYVMQCYLCYKYEYINVYR